ncbi:helicase-related protein [Mesorhizobium sp. WSM1497]|uniref:helicase-related protein n=1 Tax=Mesorhizobium sp. WSM1497 TaxID=278153 RepID=UPI0007ED209E|nr:helicase-related protein [Mesorhizobium sp. WSM1497]
MTETIQPRESVLLRLREDLIGPRAADETLLSKPSDVYLTGILWPKNTALAPEEDEHLSVAPGGEEQGEDSPEQAQAQSVAMRRPSAAGLSFAASTTHKGANARVIVNVRFATYEPVESGRSSHWKRVQHDSGPLEFELKPGNSDVPVLTGTAKGIRLNLRTVPFERGTLSTVTLVNDATPAEPTRPAVEQVTIFQVGLEIGAAAGTSLISRPSRRRPVDLEDWSSELLYRHAREFASGHTCSADWTAADSNETATLLRMEWIPEAIVPAVSPDGHGVFATLADGPLKTLSATWLSRASDADLAAALSRLCDAYSDWIDLQSAPGGDLKGDFRDAADRHLEEAKTVLGRMRGGIALLKSDPVAARAFRLSNLAMTTQREWSGKGSLIWRPFQLGFLLLTLESAAKGDHPHRETMDLLWFPTGGGKTEAYLGLIAFVAFHRRMSRSTPDNGAGVAVIMRYTLRLLTTQQFVRAAAMICACEVIRRGSIASKDATGLGVVPFSIGLWVGDKATPNTRQAAFDSRTDSSRSSPKQLLSCPCCRRPPAYRQPRPSDSVQIFCTSEGCLLSGSNPLPVWTVDEDVYAARPTLLIGTVDKFAQIVRNPDTAILFGVGSDAQPQLILQDELHLISGPLGTLAGLYESALDLILSADGSRPKIIGSTATIRRAPEQVLALFDRKTCQFPPPGLSANDSGFTVVDQELPGRRYVGITTAGRSAKFTLQAVAASLLQTAAEGLPPAQRDHYWTLVAYFNSLRELGGALVLMQDDVHDSIRLFADARSETARDLHSVEELTSRRSQAEITGMLDLLEHPAGHEAAVDVVLATNMVSVGVDIARLGLMLVNGQPKTMAEYIQATSRVGRGDISGLVVPVLNNAKPRDRSHFETFRTWHATLYREVEATSVTPFASRARDRALHAVLVAIVRHLVPGMLQLPVMNDPAIDKARDLIALVAARAARVDPLETDVGKELNDRLSRWLRRDPQQYWNRFSRDSLLQSAEEAAAKRAAGRIIGQAWPTPNSMRGVEPATHYRLAEVLKRRDDAKTPGE